MEMISLDNFIISSLLSVGTALLMLWHYKRENVYFDEFVTSAISLAVVDATIGMLLPCTVFFCLIFAVMLLYTFIDIRYMKSDAEVERKIDEEIIQKTKTCERRKMRDKVMKDIGE